MAAGVFQSTKKRWTDMKKLLVTLMATAFANTAWTQEDLRSTIKPIRKKRRDGSTTRDPEKTLKPAPGKRRPSVPSLAPTAACPLACSSVAKARVPRSTRPKRPPQTPPWHWPLRPHRWSGWPPTGPIAAGHRAKPPTARPPLPPAPARAWASSQACRPHAQSAAGAPQPPSNSAVDPRPPSTGPRSRKARATAPTRVARPGSIATARPAR